MSIDFPNGSTVTRSLSWGDFSVGHDAAFSEVIPFTFSPTSDNITFFVNESADDGSADGAYSSLAVSQESDSPDGTGTCKLTFDISSTFFETHVGTAISFEVVFNVKNNSGTTDAQGAALITVQLLPNDPFLKFPSPQAIQNDYFGITRLQLPSDQAAAENQAIVAGTTTERIFVDSLLKQVADTTIPAVAVEGSMYGAVGTSDEITKLATVFLPPQVTNATQLGLDAQVYACEALGLAFAFGNENGATTFDINFGPSNPITRATPAGDAAFATEAASAIFGAAANANTPNAILGFVTNWEAFFSQFGVPGIGTSATVSQIDLAARGAAWGDAVGVAVANNLGPLPGQVINFLEDAARGGALYSTSLASQPSHAPFEGGKPAFLTSAADVELTGVAASSDHFVM